MGFIITIEPIKESDIEEILRIQKENNLGWWQPQDYFEEIRREDSLSFTAKKEKAIIGFTVSRLITTKINTNNKYNYILEKDPEPKLESEIEIYNLAVDKNHRKEGIGSLLIQKIIQMGVKNRITSIWLEVRTSNSAAISFYKKNKFEENHRRKNFYRHPQEDALVMKLDIFNAVKNLQK